MTFSRERERNIQVGYFQPSADNVRGYQYSVRMYAICTSANYRPAIGMSSDRQFSKTVARQHGKKPRDICSLTKFFKKFHMLP